MDIPYDFSPLVQHNARNQDEKKQRSNSFYRSSVHVVRRRWSAVNAASKPFCLAVRRGPPDIAVAVVLVVADPSAMALFRCTVAVEESCTDTRPVDAYLQEEGRSVLVRK